MISYFTFTNKKNSDKPMEMAKLLFTLNANVPVVIDCNYLEYRKFKLLKCIFSTDAPLCILHNQEPKPQGRNTNTSPLTHSR